MHLKSELLSRVPGLEHGFGTRIEPIPATHLELWNRSRPDWKQVHGVGCAEVVSARQSCGEVDALFSLKAALPLAVVTADCVPILLARRRGGAAAAVHAGWRGTRARILRELAKSLVARGENLSDWVAAIGPAIGPCCYQVSEELAAEFAREFGPATGGQVVPAPRMLDLPLVNQSELRALGVAEVELLRECTRCRMEAGQPLFHSFRREGGGTRQFSVIRA